MYVIELTVNILILSYYLFLDARFRVSKFNGFKMTISLRGGNYKCLELLI